MKKIFAKKYASISLYWIIIIALILLAGIIAGSFCDKAISETIANPNNMIAKLGESFGSVIGLGTFPVAGALLTKAFIKREDIKYHRFLAILFAIVSILGAAICNSSTFSGQDGWSWKFNLFLGIFIQTIFYTGVFFLAYHFVNSETPSNLLLINALTIIIIYAAALVLTNFILKGFAYRPRYRSMVFDNAINETKAVGISYYRNWWEFNFFKYPYESIMPIHDYAKSWPSGHSTSAALILVIPFYISVSKHSSEKVSLMAFVLGVISMFLVMFLRILAGAHFLSDVCFGSLVTLVCLFIGMLIADKIQKKYVFNKKETINE